MLADGRSALSALDGGYRLAFTIALVSVIVGLVLGAVILKRNGVPLDHPESDGGSEEAVSETMIAEVL